MQAEKAGREVRRCLPQILMPCQRTVAAGITQKKARPMMQHRPRPLTRPDLCRKDQWIKPCYTDIGLMPIFPTACLILLDLALRRTCP